MQGPYTSRGHHARYFLLPSTAASQRPVLVGPMLAQRKPEDEKPERVKHEKERNPLIPSPDQQYPKP